MNPITAKVAPAIYMYMPPFMDYVGSSFADPNPVREDDWLVPAFATTEAPPKFGAMQTAIFDGEKWKVVPDYRGYKYWTHDGEGFQIVSVGVEPPHGALSEPPPPPPVELAIESEPELSVEELRAKAYADPVAGSDRLFAEAMRMQMTSEIGYEEVRDKASARYEEIRASFPKR